MLASVLHSETAVRVSLQIMDAFVSMRHFLMHNGGIVNRLVRVEGKEVEQDRRLLEHDRKIDSLFEAMDRRETDLQKVMENFIDPSTYKHFLILNGHKLEADKKRTILPLKRLLFGSNLCIFSSKKRCRYGADDFQHQNGQ